MVHWNKAYFDIVYEQYQQSGKSVRDYCNEDLHCNEDRFYYWIGKKKKELSAKIEKKQSFIRILPKAENQSLAPSSTALSLPTSVVEPSSATFVAKKIRLKYPNGTEVQIEEINDIEQLKQLITLIL